MADDPLEVLFTVEPESFTATRDAIVKRMRAEKRKAEAAVIASLRRPPATVWAMNQVVRSHLGLIDELLLAGRAAVVAQNALLRDGTIDAFNAAVERRRDIVTALVNQTIAVLKGHGVAVDQLATSLRSAFEVASIDDVIGPVLQRGQLTTLPALNDDETVVAGPASAATKSHLQLVPDLPSDEGGGHEVHRRREEDESAREEERRRNEEAEAKARVEAVRAEWEGVLAGARRQAEDATNEFDRLRAEHDSISGERAVAEREHDDTSRKRVELLEAVAQLNDRLTELDAQLAHIDRHLPELQATITSAEGLMAETREQVLITENALVGFARAESALGASDSGH